MKPCEPDCQGYADYAAVPCPNPACDDRVRAQLETHGMTHSASLCTHDEDVHVEAGLPVMRMCASLPYGPRPYITPRLRGQLMTNADGGRHTPVAPAADTRRLP